MNTPDNTYWTTRDGRKLLIADMGIGHVVNCAKMMQIKHGVMQKEKEEWRDFLCRLIGISQQQTILNILTDPNGQ